MDHNSEHKDHKNKKVEEVKPEEHKVPDTVQKYPKPTSHCLTGCNATDDTCCVPHIDPDDPNYLIPPKLGPECRGYNRPVTSFNEIQRRRTYMKEVLTNGYSTGKEAITEAQLQERKYYDQHPDTSPSLDFLKTHTEFQTPGHSPMRIPHDELKQAMNGFTNMQLAHEISINHDFRLEVYKPPGKSLEEQVRAQMKKAYWDVFDEALSEQNPNPKYAMTVFNEMKAMLIGLLLPHNHGMRQRIENFLNEESMNYEIKHKIMDISKYTDFIIEILGQLCCPMRDRQILDLKKLEKHSDLFKQIMVVMEHMQLDMANFLISQIRPTIIKNCVNYERIKFASFIEMEYKMNEDALRVTRSWLLRHRINDRPPLMVLGRAYGEILWWKEKNWPETLTLDWSRYAALAEETRRSSFLGSAVLSAFNTAKQFFGEDDKNVNPFERANPFLLRCFPLREDLRKDLNVLIEKDDCSTPEKLQRVMECLGEQAVKVTDRYVLEDQKRHMTPQEMDLIRRSVEDCAREDSPVRAILIRRLQDYITEVIAAGKLDNIDFPKALKCIEDQALSITVELQRLAIHNRAVFQDLYFAILFDKISPPEFMTPENKVWDPNVIETLQILEAKSSRELVTTKPARNEKLENVLDVHGNLILELEDQPLVSTTPKIEAMIDRIMESNPIEDDYDEYANISEQEAVKLLQSLKKHDSATIRKQMKREEEAQRRILERRIKVREDLRIQLKAEMGLPVFAKEINKSIPARKYCKLLKAFANEKPIDEVLKPIIIPTRRTIQIQLPEVAAASAVAAPKTFSRPKPKPIKSDNYPRKSSMKKSPRPPTTVPKKLKFSDEAPEMD